MSICTYKKEGRMSDEKPRTYLHASCVHRFRPCADAHWLPVRVPWHRSTMNDEVEVFKENSQIYSIIKADLPIVECRSPDVVTSFCHSCLQIVECETRMNRFSSTSIICGSSTTVDFFNNLQQIGTFFVDRRPTWLFYFDTITRLQFNKPYQVAFLRPPLHGGAHAALPAPAGRARGA